MSPILFGVILFIVVIVIWKVWKKPVAKNDNTINIVQKTAQPFTVFAVNDQGILDLSDISGKILNIGYGPNPKTYIGLLDFAEKDTEKIESDSRAIFTSKVGNTKLYNVAGMPYIIDYTRLY